MFVRDSALKIDNEFHYRLIIPAISENVKKYAKNIKIS